MALKAELQKEFAEKLAVEVAKRELVDNKLEQLIERLRENFIIDCLARGGTYNPNQKVCTDTRGTNTRISYRP